MNQEKIGKLIEECRKQKKLTQEQLAEKLYVDRTLVSKWENGKLCPDIKYFQELCSIFHIELKELISGEKINNKNEGKLNNNLFEFFLKQKLKTKVLGCLTITLLVVLFSFLVFYFVETYNKTKVFTFSGMSEHFTIDQGLLVLTREKSYFVIDDLDSDSEIDNISIYFYDNDKKHVIYEGSDINIVIDFTGYNSSINITNYKSIINKIYVAVKAEETEETIHLVFNENYNNKKILFKDDNQIDQNDNSYNNNLKQIRNLPKCGDEICSFEDENFQLFYDRSINKLTITNNKDVNIDYFFDTKYFDYSSSQTYFTVDNNSIKCNKDECIEEEKIFNDLYEKYIKPIEKS